MVASALAVVGVTPDSVSDWLNRPCGCEERKQRLNRLGVWAARVIKGKTHDALQYLTELMDD